jgi:hypothetical protein
MSHMVIARMAEVQVWHDVGLREEMVRQRLSGRRSPVECVRATAAPGHWPAPQTASCRER